MDNSPRLLLKKLEWTILAKFEPLTDADLVHYLKQIEILFEINSELETIIGNLAIETEDQNFSPLLSIDNDRQSFFSKLQVTKIELANALEDKIFGVQLGPSSNKRTIEWAEETHYAYFDYFGLIMKTKETSRKSS